MEAGAHIHGSPREVERRGPESGGLIRQRLTSRLLDPGAYRVGRVVAPAGSGKSRLLAHVADSYQGPVAWCGPPDPVPRTEPALMDWLWNGIRPAIGAVGPAPSGVQGLVDALVAPDPPVLVIADDVHFLEGSEPEPALADLIRRLPAGMRLLMASRVNLALDLSRLRVSDQLVEIGPDDLRFRTWEVEELFQDVYQEPLIPEEVATLARRTGGWAAYLQLFHLATSRKPLVERRRVLNSLANRTRLVQEYLTRHVLAGLSSDLQDFLIRTSVLRRPTVALCDELLGWTQGSRALLAELERRQLFTERVDDDSYRYHAVLLSYLEARLVDAVGAPAARNEHHRAAVLLERDGVTEDAAAAFAKAEDWEGVARTLGHPGSTAGLGGAWLEALPPAVVETDSQLLMARARRALATGALAESVATMRAAEEVAASSLVAERCRQERDRVSAWISAERPLGRDWSGLLRAATQRQPRDSQRAATALSGPSARFAEGAAAFVAGDMVAASRLLRDVSTHPDSVAALTAGARLMGTIAVLMSGRVPDDGELDRVRDEVEEAGIPWLDRIAQGALAAFNGPSGESLDNLSDACRRQGDGWGEALLAFMTGTGHLRMGQRAIAYFQLAARLFDEVGAAVLQTLAYGYLGLAAHAAGDVDLAARSAHQARSQASLLEVPAAAGLAALALGRTFGDKRELARARELLEPLGTWEWHFGLGTPAPGAIPAISSPGDANLGALSGNGALTGSLLAPSDRRGPQTSGGQAAHSTRVFGIQLRCLGGFSLAIQHRVVDDAAAKPMERILLHVLAMSAGEPVHREALIEALWPEADPDAGLHRLQVAVSALRRLLAPAVDGSPPLLTREGDSYRLALPPDSDVDLWQVEAHLRQGAAARQSGQSRAEEEALAAALGAYGGPLLPGDGPAEWVVSRRAALQVAAVDAAERLTALRLERSDPQAATESARVGVGLDRYRDELWQQLIEAAERCGHYAEAGQARRTYAAILEELGV